MSTAFQFYKTNNHWEMDFILVCEDGVAVSPIIVGQVPTGLGRLVVDSVLPGFAGNGLSETSRCFIAIADPPTALPESFDSLRSNIVYGRGMCQVIDPSVANDSINIQPMENWTDRPPPQGQSTTDAGPAVQTKRGPWFEPGRNIMVEAQVQLDDPDGTNAIIRVKMFGHFEAGGPLTWETSRVDATAWQRTRGADGRFMATGFGELWGTLPAKPVLTVRPNPPSSEVGLVEQLLFTSTVVTASVCQVGENLDGHAIANMFATGGSGYGSGIVSFVTNYARALPTTVFANISPYDAISAHTNENGIIVITGQDGSAQPYTLFEFGDP